ncbi:hypothetical protein BU202_03820 [Streptococcus cuniculi]|uniref:Uncharacterized protein n=1 Tax=Streptococcus cuniculi TaxID=1432788 RepID=A0A1Q8E8L5_9STRE|nr:hypothetical protein [Streptococcus cuniculi]OLF48129.1 hypothetical protein BU202_03820 [Streptococcus cuniculi]
MINQDILGLFDNFKRNLMLERCISQFIHLGFISDNDSAVDVLEQRLINVFEGKEIPNRHEALQYLSLFSFDLTISQVNILLENLFDGVQLLSNNDPIDLLYYQHYKNKFQNHSEFLSILSAIQFAYMANQEEIEFSLSSQVLLGELIVAMGSSWSEWIQTLKRYLLYNHSHLEEVLFFTERYMIQCVDKENPIDAVTYKEYRKNYLAVKNKQIFIPRLFIIIYSLMKYPMMEELKNLYNINRYQTVVEQRIKFNIYAR